MPYQVGNGSPLPLDLCGCLPVLVLAARLHQSGGDMSSTVTNQMATNFQGDHHTHAIRTQRAKTAPNEKYMEAKNETEPTVTCTLLEFISN
jgi:hypothetical protein